MRHTAVATRQKQIILSSTTQMHVPKDSIAIAKLMAELFRGREDRIMFDDGHGQLHNYDADGPLTAEVILSDHLSGAGCYGQFPLLANGTIHFAAVDFDNKPHNPQPNYRQHAADVASSLASAGLKPLVEISQSGNGVHVWLFFQHAVAAALVRALLKGLLTRLGVPDLEIFPKQDCLTPKVPCGNAIRLPLFNKSHFVDPSASWKKLPALEALRGVSRLTMQQLMLAAEQLEIDLNAPFEEPDQDKEAGSDSGGSVATEGLSPYVHRLLADSNSTLRRRWDGDSEGLSDGSRSAIAMSIACCLVRAFVPTSDIEDALRLWCYETGYRKGERGDWVALTIEKAYAYIQAQKPHPGRGESTDEMENLPPAIRREYIRANKRNR